MKHAVGHRQLTAKARSTNAILSPYFIDDVAMTASEFASNRHHDVMVVAPR